MMKNSNFLLLLMTFIFVSACTKDEDNIPPFVSITSTSVGVINDDNCGTATANVLRLDSGGLLEVDVRFTDDTALSECTVTVTQNFDCNAGKTSTWDLVDIVPISGVDISPTIPIPIPTDASAGDYRLTIVISDEAGNISNTAFRNLKIEHPDDRIVPTLTVNSPSTTVTVSKGAAIDFVGEMSDNNLLGDCGVGGITLQYEDTANDEIVLLNRVNLDAANVTNTFNFNFNYTIPTSWVSGTYTFRLIAYDEVHNASQTAEFQVTVTE